MRHGTSVIMVLLLALAGCSDSGAGTPALDTLADVATDAAGEVVDDVLPPDTTADAVTDTGLDTEPDIPMDSFLDVPEDTPADIPTDTPTEVVPPECVEDDDCAWLETDPCMMVFCSDAGLCGTKTAPNETSCDDGNSETCNDACVDGACQGGACGTVTVTGMVWKYTCMFCDYPNPESGYYYMEPAGGVIVETVGLDGAGEVSTTTSEDQCYTWWEPESDATCGWFTLEIPEGATLSLRVDAQGSGEFYTGFLNGLGPMFTADDDSFQVLVIPQLTLVEAIYGLMGETYDPLKGVLAGITAVLTPEPPTLFAEFIGGATVTLDPEPSDPDFLFVYLDAEDPLNMGLTSTDKDQPLFFGAGMPPAGADAPYVASAAHADMYFEDLSFMVEPGALTYLPFSPGPPPEPVEIKGRIWSYFVAGMTLMYDFPYASFTVTAYGADGAALEQTESSDDCQPWNPTYPYQCGTFSLSLDAGLSVALKATGVQGFMDTLTRVFTVQPGANQLIVAVDEDVVDLVSMMWGSSAQAGTGHVVGVFAVPASDGVFDSPFSSFIGDASVLIEPAADLPQEFELVYYDPLDPTNKNLTDTVEEMPVFVGLNLPPRPVGDPYTLTIFHPDLTFDPVSFPVQDGVLTYLVLTPQ